MSAIAQAGGLVLLPILTRALSVDAYGSVDVVATFVTFLTILLQAALPSALSRDYQSPENREGTATLVSTLLAFVAFGGALLAGGAALAAEPLARLLFDGPEAADYIRLGCATSWLSAMLGIAYVTLRMQRRIVAFNALRMLQTLAYVGVTLALVLAAGRGVRGVFEAQVVAHGTVLVGALMLIRGELTPKLSRERLRAALSFSLPMLPGRFLLILNEQIDRLLLLFFIGLPGVALLGVAARIASLMQFALVVFRQAWHPHAMGLLDTPRRDELFGRMLNYYAGAFALGGLALCAIGPELFAWIVPEEYRRGYLALPWLIGAAILHQSATLTNVGPLAERETQALTGAATLALAINLVLALLLIPTFGIAGAAIGVFVANLAYTAVLWRASARVVEAGFAGASVLRALGVYVVCATTFVLAWLFTEGLTHVAIRAGAMALAVAILLPPTLDPQARRLLAELRARLEP